MKKLTVILLFGVVFLNNTYSQEYFPFPDSNAIWNETLTNTQPISIENYQYGIDGDTIINSLIYHKIYMLEDTVFPLELDQYCGAIREDEQKKIHFVACYCCVGPFPPDQDLILYDFSKNAGDTVFVGFDGIGPIGYYIIDYTDSILIDSTYRKTFHFVDYDYFEYWIEGIGSTRGLFSPITPDFFGHYLWELVCFNQEGIVKYLNPDYDSCFPIITNVYEENAPPIQLQVIPNPVMGIGSLDLSMTNLEFTKLSIYNAQGIQMNNIRLIDQSKVEFSIYNYPPGIYLVLLESKNHKIVSKKFIVAN